MTRFTCPELPLATWGFALNAVWEFAHTPFYSDADRGLFYISWTRLHCTAGDVLILLGSYWATALIFRDRHWPPRGALPSLVFMAVGLGYTIFSEWLNISIRWSWDYTDSMPQVFGIGLTPILQWLLIPPVVVWQLRRRYERGSSVTARPFQTPT